ncbi:zinc-binding dehydrogenase [Neorhizobium sp. AL 9.2.2]|uniref:zinc-dependent alcohol dehydrogenase n=1 Tax=Neorhizobium sp. AL 9.2.2 TaxID=2712894 RepID=UPI001572198F|nr:alcohol dehydrogenase catalytic domain-containing protein [Neorhizobium sp. AL 9.2.2]NSY18476.1 alcohol dehydrogenase catalytic domain-containing protein [Neorhizobium sp. AL 9.2.2]
MIALRKTAPAFGLELVSLDPMQAPLPGQVLIDVAAAGICGSDLHAYEWTPGYEFMTASLPVTVGHEFSGVVRSVGDDVKDFAAGDRVVCWPTKNCGSCPACLAGEPQNCSRRRIIGLHCDGGFADTVIVPARNCRHVPDDLDLAIAALTEPLAVAVNAVDVADVQAGSRVVVLGPGPIGLGIAWAAAHRGAHVLIAGFGDERRLSLARDMGIHHASDLMDETLEQAVSHAFGQPADRVIEATGIARSVSDGLAVLRPGGIFVVAGIHSQPLSLDLTRFVREKKQLRGAHDTTERALGEAIRLLAQNSQALSALITHRLPLSEGIEAFELARSRQAVKVLLLPEGNGVNIQGETA